jgi:hypothetical protein
MCFIITFCEACYFATDLCNMFDRAWLWMLIFLYFRLSFPVYCHTLIVGYCQGLICKVVELPATPCLLLFFSSWYCTRCRIVSPDMQGC